MVFDLGKALLKKEEFESARLTDFEFRQRARTFRLLARQLALDEDEGARRIIAGDDQQIIGEFAQLSGRDVDEVRRIYGQCRGESRSQLIAELGDPTPHRLG